MSVVALDSRRPLSIGGSEAGAACGLDPYRSRVMLWAEKTGRVQREPTEAMLWGTLIEPVIYAELERRGFETMPAPAAGFRDEDRPWLVGHPDGFTAVDGQAAILEVKTAGHWAGQAWNGGNSAPLHYLAQLHHYFELTGYSMGLLACLVAGQRLELRVVPRDDVAIARMLELQEEFLGHVKADTPPPPDGTESSGAALAQLYPQSDSGRVVRLTREDWDAFRELKARREQRDAIDHQVKALEQRLKLVMGEAETAISPHDETVIRWSTHDVTRVDVKALREQRPELATLFTTTTTQRRFTVE